MSDIEVCYRVLTPSDEDETVSLLGNEFAERELLCSYLRLPAAPTLCEYFRAYVRPACTNGLSMGAFVRHMHANSWKLACAIPSLDATDPESDGRYLL